MLLSNRVVASLLIARIAETYFAGRVTPSLRMRNCFTWGSAPRPGEVARAAHRPPLRSLAGARVRTRSFRRDALHN
jgi:hypothetical protein